MANYDVMVALQKAKKEARLLVEAADPHVANKQKRDLSNYHQRRYRARKPKRLCLDCGADISHRGSRAVRCETHAQEYKLARHKVYQARAHRKYMYGLGSERYDMLRLAQINRCGICDEPLDQQGPSHVDHDHETGAVRGLLCADCNRGLGCFKDSPDVLQSAI